MQSNLRASDILIIHGTCNVNCKICGEWVLMLRSHVASKCQPEFADAAFTLLPSPHPQRTTHTQNQFFISSLLTDNVTNGIADALRLRIARAHKEGKKFRVIIVMPLLPSFEGRCAFI